MPMFANLTDDKRKNFFRLADQPPEKSWWPGRGRRSGRTSKIFSAGRPPTWKKVGDQVEVGSRGWRLRLEVEVEGRVEVDSSNSSTLSVSLIQARTMKTITNLSSMLQNRNKAPKTRSNPGDMFLSVALKVEFAAHAFVSKLHSDLSTSSFVANGSRCWRSRLEVEDASRGCKSRLKVEVEGREDASRGWKSRSKIV